MNAKERMMTGALLIASGVAGIAAYKFWPWNKKKHLGANSGAIKEVPLIPCPRCGTYVLDGECNCGDPEPSS